MSGRKAGAMGLVERLASAVHLRQQVETAEFTRALIEQQKAAQQPPGGPLAC